MSHLAPRAGNGSGFTLVEVLIALALLVILISVTASTLGVTLRAEQSMDLLDEGWRVSQSAHAELYVTGHASNTLARHAQSWSIVLSPATTGGATNPVQWAVWEIGALARPSVQWRMALQE